MEDNSSKIFNLIDQFANGELSETRSKEVKAKIKSDPEYKRLWDYQQTLSKVIGNSDQLEEVNLKGLPKSVKVRQMWIRLAIAASVAVMMALFLYLFFPATNHTTLTTEEGQWETPQANEQEGLIGSSGNRLTKEIRYTELLIREGRVISQKSTSRMVSFVLQSEKTVQYKLDENGLQIRTTKTSLTSLEDLHWVSFKIGSGEKQVLHGHEKWHEISFNEDYQFLLETEDSTMLKYLNKIR